MSALLTVACWNTEWHAATSPKGRRLKAALLATLPDIVCLPEARYDFLLPTHHGLHSHPDNGYPLKSSRSKVTLWSRWPWTNVDQLGSHGFPPGRFVSGTTETPRGPVRVIGVCIPYRHAHVSTGERNRAVWEDHERYLEVLPEVLERERRHGPALLLGDFNQRIPARWVPPRLASMLAEALGGFEVWTAGHIHGLESQLVCHIAGSDHLKLAAQATGLTRLIEGATVSDHDGSVLQVLS